MTADPARARALDLLTAAFKLEDQIFRAMEEEGVNATELAKRLHADKAMISRDLRGGLTRANYQRIVQMGQALNHDVVTLVLPRSRIKRKKTLEKAFNVLK
jgi:ribosome-binding protein aMBF1 (putative translation factor)